MSAFADQFSLQENGRNVKDFLKKTGNQKTAAINPVRLKLRFQVMYALSSEWHCDFYFNAYRLNTASHNIMKKSDLLDR